MVVTVLACAARVHTHSLDAAYAVTQEMACCLRLVTAAASRRGMQSPPSDPPTSEMYSPGLSLR
jgi:hypothetical protein